MRVHPLEILLSPDIVDLVTGGPDDLLARVKALRRRIAPRPGLITPPVRTPRQHRTRTGDLCDPHRRGRDRARHGTDRLGAGPRTGPESLPGTATLDPVFGLEGKWIPLEMRHSAEFAGATVIDRASVIITHLSSVIHSMPRVC